jgi:hypothetical protein
VFLNFDAIDPKHYMADVGNLILPGGAGGEDDDPEAVTAEQDGKSNLLGLFLEAIMPVGWTTVFIQVLLFCRSHPTIMGVRALGVVTYAVAVAGLLFGVLMIYYLITIFFCGNIDGESQQDEVPTIDMLIR